MAPPGGVFRSIDIMRQRILNAVPMLLALSTLLLASPSFGALKMFVTSDTHNGDFDGIANADAFCQSAAANATPPLSGTFRAWLSTTTDDAFCHVAGLSGQAPNCGQAQA